MCATSAGTLQRHLHRARCAKVSGSLAREPRSARCGVSLARAMADTSMTTAEALLALRVVWRHVWQHVAAQETPPVYVVQSHTTHSCPCGSTACTSPFEECPNGTYYGAFTITRKTHLVSLSLDAAKQCARDALRAMLEDDNVNFRLVDLEEGERLPVWLSDYILWGKGFYAWWEVSGEDAGKNKPCAFITTVRKERLDGACKAQLRRF